MPSLVLLAAALAGEVSHRDAGSCILHSMIILAAPQWLPQALGQTFRPCRDPSPISLVRQKLGRSPVRRGVVLVGILSDVTHVDLSASPATSVNKTASISGQASRSVCGPPSIRPFYCRRQQIWQPSCAFDTVHDRQTVTETQRPDLHPRFLSPCLGSLSFLGGQTA